MMNDKQTAEFLGLHSNYFSTLKHSNIEFYKHLKRNGNNLYDGWIQYKSETESLLAELERIYYILHEARKISELVKLGDELYSNKESTRTSIENILFGQRDMMQYSIFMKMKILLYRWHIKNKTKFNFEK